MNSELYFRPTPQYFWQWEEDMEVIAVPGGNTIVYQKPLMQILEVLANQGLPQLGPVLLALSAVSPSKDILFAQIKRAVLDGLGEDVVSSDTDILDNAFIFLEALSGVPDSLKKGQGLNQLLLTVFENVHNQIGPIRAQLVLRYLQLNAGKHTAYREHEFNPFYTFRFEFRILELLARQFPDTQAIMKKMSGLPDFNPEELEIDEESEPEVEQPDFIQELIENPKSFHVGALIKRIWSGLNIPVHSLLPSEQPLGGVSDLTNKGDFDKLLISEFANDDLVFMSRLANNEALYIRREIPPARNNLNRIILLDVSVKNWGTPKTIAYSIMTAIARHPKTDIGCAAFAVGNNLHPVGYETVEQVIEGLRIMEGSLEPSKGLEQFIQLFGNDKNLEVIFISTAETMRLPAMQKFLFEHPAFLQYWILTDVTGRVSLFKKQHHVKKHVQDIVLPLNELWAKPPEPPSKQSKQQELSMPAPVNIPLLLDGLTKPGKMMVTSDGEVFAINAWRCLIKAVNKDFIHKKGWELIHERLPMHINQVQIGKMKDGKYILLMLHQASGKFTLLDIQAGEEQLFDLPKRKMGHGNYILFYKEIFYWFTGHSYWSIHPITGATALVEIGPELPIPSLHLKNQEMLNNKAKMGLIYRGIVKNIDQVGINEKGNLMLNKLEYQILYGNQLYLTSLKRDFAAKVTIPKTAGSGEFWFPDGSVVYSRQEGIVGFISSDKSIPEFFLPTVIDHPIAIGTARSFAGNEHYCPQRPGVTLEIHDAADLWNKLMGRFIQHILTKNGY